MSFLMLEAKRRFKKSPLKVVIELVDWREARRIIGRGFKLTSRFSILLRL